jgi:hypothetical protein
MFVHCAFAAVAGSSHAYQSFLPAMCHAMKLLAVPLAGGSLLADVPDNISAAAAVAAYHKCAR